MEKRFICDLPWTHISIHPHSTCSVCCVADHTHEQSSASNRDENGNFFNLLTINDKIEKIINSDSFKSIRKTMIEGGIPNACKTCKIVEESGGRSKRLRDSHIFPNVDLITAEDGTIDVDLRTVEVRLGNFCNLKCRSCNAESSTSWISDYYKLKDIVPLPSGYDNLKKGKHINYDWVDSENFYNDLISNSKNIEQLHISGGEPFLVPKHFYLLDKLIEDGLAKNINIFYITNANYDFDTIRPALEKLTKFKNVYISFSVDDVRERNSYIRSLSNWDLTIKNIKKFTTEYPFFYTITQTINAFNFMYMEELSQFLINENLYNQYNENNKIKYIISNHVHSPEYQNARVLPLDERRKKIDSVRHLLSPSFYSDVYGRYYNSEDNGQLTLFKNVTNAVDLVRNESFEKIFPLTYDIIKNIKII